MTDSDDTYERIARGVGVVLVGNLLGMGLAFLARIVPARYLTPTEYGNLALAVTVLNITALVGTLGLYDGIARTLPRSDSPDADFTAGFVAAVAVSAAVAGLLVVFATPISELFVGQSFAPVLVVIAVGIPAMAAFRVMTGGFRGVEDAFGRVVLQNVTMRGTVLVGIVIAIVFEAGAVGAALGWTAALFFTTVVGGVLLSRRRSLFVPLTRWPSATLDRAGPLLTFSLPLLGATAVWQLMQEIDNLLLGVFVESADIAAYDAGFTLARLVMLFFWPAGFFLLPVFSDLDRVADRAEMDRLYALVTKWIVVFSLPLVLFLWSFPVPIMRTIYKPALVGGAPVLVLVSAAFFVHLLAGTNRQVLTAFGDTRFIFVAVGGAFLGNVLLNVLLIPRLGIVGAGVATAVSYTALNLVFGIRLYRTDGISPTTRRAIPALVPSLLLFAGIYVLFTGPVGPTFGRLLLAGIGYSVCHLVAFVFAGGLQPADVDLLERLDETAPVDLSGVIAVVRRRTN